MLGPCLSCWQCCSYRARGPSLAAQAWVKILTLAFLVVGGSCGLLIPVMLYVLDLRSEGWTWQYCALFGSMVASTDAVAIVSTMKASEPLTSLHPEWTAQSSGCEDYLFHAAIGPEGCQVARVVCYELPCIMCPGYPCMCMGRCMGVLCICCCMPELGLPVCRRGPHEPAAAAGGGEPAE